MALSVKTATVSSTGTEKHRKGRWAEELLLTKDLEDLLVEKKVITHPVNKVLFFNNKIFAMISGEESRMRVHCRRICPSPIHLVLARMA